MLKWLKKNREWLFSGIGVLFLTTLFSVLKKSDNPRTQPINARSGSTIINVPGSTGNINVNSPNNRQSKAYPVIDLSRPIEEQVQLFATDEVQIYADSNKLHEVWFGGIWEPYEPGRKYIAWGIPDKPITPKFRGIGKLKMRIEYSVDSTNNLEQARDIRRLR